MKHVARVNRTFQTCWYRLFIAFFLLAALGATSPAHGQKRSNPQVKLTNVSVKIDEVVYKTTPQGELKLHFFSPPDARPADRRPAIVFFFGGGWKNGSFVQFVPQAEYFASRGLVCASADYRISSIHKTTPDKCVEDAKSAIRWVRAHAAELGVDPAKIIASGGSAGGHLAAATALVPGFESPEDDKSVSCKPAALVLFNPALDLTLAEVGRIQNAEGKDIRQEFSPTFFLARDTPPAVIFFGTADKMVVMGRDYAKKAAELGVRAEHWTATDQPHGFFNRSPWCEVTARKADEFLISLGFLSGEPSIKLPESVPVLTRE